MHKSIVLCDELPTDYLQEVNFFLDEWMHPDSSILVKTSGSTGIPKEITLQKEKVTASAKATGEFFKFQSGQTVLLNLSPQYIAGKLMIVRALVHDMSILIAPATQNPLETITTESIDFGAFVPYQVEAILADPVTRNRFEKIRNVIIGGAPVSAELESSLRELPNQIYSTFGMTETITHIALRNITRNESAYTCLPGIKVSADERGCLIIHKNKISEELITNDCVEIVTNTSFVWKGRADNVVNSAGVKLFPEELEREIESLMDERRFFFWGRESRQFGQELVLYIEGSKIGDQENLRQKLAQKLSRYARPKAIVYIQKFDETPTGKVIRRNYDR